MVTVLSTHMTMKEHLDPILRTKPGQAHIAGTGPDGATCRECAKWHNRSEGDADEVDDYRYRGEGKGILYLQPAKCNHRIMGKADKRVPHDAGACRLFVASENPPPTQRPDRRFKAAS